MVSEMGWVEQGGVRWTRGIFFFFAGSTIWMARTHDGIQHSSMIYRNRGSRRLSLELRLGTREVGEGVKLDGMGSNIITTGAISIQILGWTAEWIIGWNWTGRTLLDFFPPPFAEVLGWCLLYMVWYGRAGR